MDKLLTLRQLCDMLQVSRSTRIGKVLRFDEEEVAQWIKQNK
jgi:predicted DNA-binding transcriptional regulator AlpA